MYPFTGNNIFVSIEDKPIKNKKFKPIEKSKKYTKNPNISFFTLICKKYLQYKKTMIEIGHSYIVVNIQKSISWKYSI